MKIGAEHQHLILPPTCPFVVSRTTWGNTRAPYYFRRKRPIFTIPVARRPPGGVIMYLCYRVWFILKRPCYFFYGKITIAIRRELPCLPLRIWVVDTVTVVAMEPTSADWEREWAFLPPLIPVPAGLRFRNTR